LTQALLDGVSGVPAAAVAPAAGAAEGAAAVGAGAAAGAAAAGAAAAGLAAGAAAAGAAAAGLAAGAAAAAGLFWAKPGEAITKSDSAVIPQNPDLNPQKRETASLMNKIFLVFKSWSNPALPLSTPRAYARPGTRVAPLKRANKAGIAAIP
jgi:hypothetical protein